MAACDWDIRCRYGLDKGIRGWTCAGGDVVMNQCALAGLDSRAAGFVVVETGNI